MENNVYIRSKKSVMSISLMRIVMLIPLLIYGFYKNGIYLYRNHLVNTFTMFKPLILIFGSIIIAAIINFCYEYFYKKNHSNKIIDSMFSSFHIEYALLLACLMSINVNILVYFGVLIVVLIISKFIGKYFNTVCAAFIIIYIITELIGDFSYLNVYEASKTFSYDFLDYLVGRAPGGIAATHIILLAIAFIGLAITNNNKTGISLIAIISYVLITFVYAILTQNSFMSVIFSNNYLFIATFIATDSPTSCYTNRGMILSGVIIALITFGVTFINPIIAPFVAVLFMSFFAHFIDEKIYVLSRKSSR